MLWLGTLHNPRRMFVLLGLAMICSALSIWSNLMTLLLDLMSAEAVRAKTGVPRREKKQKQDKTHLLNFIT